MRNKLQLLNRLLQVKQKLSSETNLVQKALDLSQHLQQQQQYLLTIRQNLPSHLPTPIISSNTAPSSTSITLDSSTQSTVAQEKENVNSSNKRQKLDATATVKPPKPKGRKNAHTPPELAYITVSEFDSVPKYVRGRLTMDRINEGVDQIRLLLLAKYKILRTPPTKLNDKLLKEYKIFKDSETDELRDEYFFCSTDLRRSDWRLALSSTTNDNNLSNGTMNWKVVLTILRYVSRLKQAANDKFVLV